MMLDMTVKQRQSRLVRRKVYTCTAIGRHYHGILDDPRRRLKVNLGELELVAMQVHRMSVVGTVVKRQPVTSALFEHKLLLVRIRFAVYGKTVELAGAA